MPSSYTYMKDDTLTYNDFIEVATELARTVSSHKENLNTVYSTFKIMTENFSKGEVFEVNYTNLKDLSKHDGSKIFKQSTLLLRGICQPIKNTTVVKYKRSWVKYNQKGPQRKKYYSGKVCKNQNIN